MSAIDAYREAMAKNLGCWVAYGLDHSEHWSTTVFDDELKARRYAMDNYLHVGYLRWGESLDKAPKSDAPSP